MDDNRQGLNWFGWFAAIGASAGVAWRGISSFLAFCTTAMTRINALEKSRDELIESRDLKDQQIKELNGKVSGLLANIASLNKKDLEQQTEIDGLRADLATARRERVLIQAELDTAEANLAKYKRNDPAP